MIIIDQDQILTDTTLDITIILGATQKMTRVTRMEHLGTENMNFIKTCNAALLHSISDNYIKLL